MNTGGLLMKETKVGTDLTRSQQVDWSRPSVSGTSVQAASADEAEAGAIFWEKSGLGMRRSLQERVQRF